MNIPEREPRPIFYERSGDTVTLEMSADDYNMLLLAIGHATGSAVRDQNQELADSYLRLADSMTHE